MKIAVVKTGGKQYIVEDGLILAVEKLVGKEGDTVEVEVLFTDDGTTAMAGKELKGKTMPVTIKEHGKNKKLQIVRYKAKSRYHKRTGHRQPHTKITVGKV